MTIELSVFLSVLSVGFAITMGIIGLRRNNKADDRAEATLLATMNTTLDRVAKDVAEIKGELKDIRCEVKNHGERLVCVEQQVKVLNKTVFDREGA
jgi:uncharacterized protein (UPF0335 family)